MILKLNENFNEDTLDKVIDFYNKVNEKADEKAVIYLKSDGGYLSIAEALVDLINTYSDKTTIIAYHFICSSAFELFFKVNCEKRLAGGVLGMYHQSCTDINFNENMKPNYPSDKALIVKIKGYLSERTKELCEQLEFTEKEKKVIAKGDDLYFQPERMQGFIDNQKIKP
jgi:hypothetical protein